MLACANDLGAFALRVEGAGLQDYAFVATAENGGDVGVEADINALGAEIICPVAVEALKVGKGDHEGEIGKKRFWVVVPKFHVGVIEEAFEDRTGDVWGLIASAQEEGDEGYDHFLAEFLVEKEHA